MNELVNRLKQEGQDFEWYPTTEKMIISVLRKIPEDANSIMDIGAGDGRVLARFAEKCKRALLYSIEKSPILQQQQPAFIIPVGTDLYEQMLAALEVDYIFCNPIYSEFEEWIKKIIDEAYAKKAFVIVPQRWKESQVIKDALKKRGATTAIVYSDDFLHAERAARAIVDIVEISFPKEKESWNGKVEDPFKIWFDANVKTFEKVTDVKDETESALQKRLGDASIDEIVEAYDHEYKILLDNYQMIFKLDAVLLTELGVDKTAIREGLKMKMSGLKVKYWKLLFDKLDPITSRLTTKSKNKVQEKLNGNKSVNFTVSNCYAVIIWAIKNANSYFDEQAVELFFALAYFESVMNYKSNLKTWAKDGWRYGHAEKPTYFKLDYRVVVEQHSRGIYRNGDYSQYDYPGNLYKDYHDLLADIKAVFSNLGFSTNSLYSKNRVWRSGQWQNYYHDESEEILYQAKAYMNGNMHFRFMPEAIKALNVYVARTLKWVRTVEDVIVEMEIPVDEAIKYFKHNPYITVSNVKLLKG